MRWWLVLALAAACSADGAPAMSKAALGERVFADPNMSSPAGQACADCHHPQFTFRDPEGDHATSMGVVQGRFGTRNAPSILYAAFVPPLHYDAATRRWIGGLFWDGRAATLEDQVAGPLLDPREMNNPDKAAVVDHVRQAPYARDFRELYGPHALDNDDEAFAYVADALAAYERSPALAPFSSKYDRVQAGAATFTPDEQRGLELFQHSCASCHPPPMFTDYSYANLGIPKYTAEGAIDRGLGAVVGDPAQDGKFRTPTLRNIARTAPYGHAGYFENLGFLVDFLATRDTGSRDVATCSRIAGGDAICPWPPAEVPANVDPRVGHLALDARAEADLLAFLRTLTDEPATAPSSKPAR
ncbi:MAG TPA: cytochrome c peroxidase [Kofleriaceae bacterium]|nr:cytochrome c peroxidase [Kofleriaceae bacterium]